jgi:hypothetical protein
MTAPKSKARGKRNRSFEDWLAPIGDGPGLQEFSVPITRATGLCQETRRQSGP